MADTIGQKSEDNRPGSNDLLGRIERKFMELTLVNDAARAVHLLGLALGFGVAIVADLSAARTIVRPLTWSEIETLER